MRSETEAIRKVDVVCHSRRPVVHVGEALIDFSESIMQTLPLRRLFDGTTLVLGSVCFSEHSALSLD
jgi:hypothetical protein